MKDIGKPKLRLKELRKQKKITQKHLALAIGIGQTAIANYENGKRFPDERILIRLSDYFSVSIDSMLCRSDDTSDIAAVSSFSYQPSASLRKMVDDFMEKSISSSRKASELIHSLLSAGYSEEQISLDLLETALIKTGKLWETGEYNEAMEHQLSSTVIEIMMLMKAQTGASAAHRGNAAALTVAGEKHDIGLRMICRFLEIDGWDCFFIGSSVPPAALTNFIESGNIDLLLLSYTLSEHTDSAVSIIENIRTLKTPPRIAVGGRGTLRNVARLRSSGADYISTSAADLIHWTRNIIKVVEE